MADRVHRIALGDVLIERDGHLERPSLRQTGAATMSALAAPVQRMLEVARARKIATWLSIHRAPHGRREVRVDRQRASTASRAVVTLSIGAAVSPALVVVGQADPGRRIAGIDRERLLMQRMAARSLGRSCSPSWRA